MKKKREKSKVIVRPWLLLFFIATLSISLVSLGLLELYKFITESNRFKIKKVIINGMDVSSVEKYIKGYAKGQNIILFNKEKLKRRIEMNPDVKAVKIKIKFPDTLVIDIEKEVPFALILIDSDLFYVDSDGKIFKIKRAGDFADLPIITGLSPKDLNFSFRLKKCLEIISLFLKKNVDQISELHITKYGSVYVYFTKPKIEIVFSYQIEYLDQNKITKKIAKLKKVLNYFANYDQINPTLIDLDCIKKGAIVRLGNISNG